MNMYETLSMEFEHCISMSKKFMEKKDVNMAIFWKNAATGLYMKMQALVLEELTTPVTTKVNAA